MGVSRAVTIPALSVVSSSNAVARSLCAFRRCPNAVKPAAQASKSNKLASNVLLLYKVIGVHKYQAMNVNDKAHEFALANEEGQTVSLKDYRGKNVILFFFPKASSSG
jgi:hypothetical protein